ncbi:Acetyltransferase (GNAT) family protein [Pelagimonas phthalicica]|uniref:Acetyltransferase (GNAT) family protein n=1 Tax=Pelagimonas phthalicica TaxID=1037362 RepID=A0A238JCS0_9RHOB|nr:GNAT family N-acetyltransferase [Pelagimonas phthalicica]TDS93840.1 ribosomal protein S18 acetylase RimI-like enzyme [Pelagimonas phthalicica]SMX27636.1 Acetyltransferase (GNAT) family protein [Pelagimonas phthalicica]
MTLTVEALTGDAFDAALDDLAQLRIEVFRAFPYLYDGDMDYERHYLRSYRNNPHAILVAARDGDKIVGAATGMPFVDHADATQIIGALPHAEQTFYCAESVLLPGYRGHGIGHRFFDLREEQARKLGLTHCAFCAVIRPEDHALRHKGYASLDPFWRKRGYAPVPDVMAEFTWTDVDQHSESKKRLQFWQRQI